MRPLQWALHDYIRMNMKDGMSYAVIVGLRKPIVSLRYPWTGQFDDLDESFSFDVLLFY